MIGLPQLGLILACCAYTTQSCKSTESNRLARMEVPSILNLEAGDVTKTPQCKQAGVQDCKKVSLNLASLTGLKPGDKVNLTPGGILLTFRSLQGSSSYDFTTPGGLEALFTVTGTGGKSPSMTGSIHHNGRIYVVESCGEGCHVLYYRDQSFFDNLED